MTAIRNAVFEGRDDDAVARWTWFSARLLAHIDVEETHLLPIYDNLGPFPPNATPAIFRREHARIIETLALIETLFAGERVALCTALCSLEGQLEHHDLREADSFKPRVDAATADGRAAEALAAHEALVKAIGPAPSSTQPQPSPRGGSTRLTGVDKVRWTLAHGDAQGALTLLSELPLGEHPKAPRLREKTRVALRSGDLPTAWDRLRLLHIVMSPGGQN